MGLWLNTNGMTTDELLKKEAELRKKLYTVMRLGVSNEIVTQLQNMINDVRLAAQESLVVKKDGNSDDDNFDDYLNIG